MSNPQWSTAQVQHGDPLIGTDLTASGMESGIAMSAEHCVPGHLLCSKSRLISSDTALLPLYVCLRAMLDGTMQ